MKNVQTQKLNQKLTNSERTKIWYQNNREKKLAYQKEYKRTHKKEISKYYYRLKKEVLSHYSDDTPKCAICGETDLTLLELDHINGDGSKHRRQNNIIGGTQTYLWVKRKGYPKIFQVLCGDCNITKGSHQLISKNTLEKTAITIEEWIHQKFDKSWEPCDSCGLMACQHNEIICPFRDFKVIPKFLSKKGLDKSVEVRKSFIKTLGD